MDTKCRFIVMRLQDRGVKTPSRMRGRGREGAVVDWDMIADLCGKYSLECVHFLDPDRMIAADDGNLEVRPRIAVSGPKI